MGSTASSIGSFVTNTYRQVGRTLGANEDTMSALLAVHSPLLGIADFAKRNLIDNPKKKAEEAANNQIKAQQDEQAKYDENVRVSDLASQRDRQLIQARSAARSRSTRSSSAAVPLTGNVLGVVGSGGRSLIGG